jgi:alkylation response protein AidB-like acyl-CoA dehydrogenase
MIARVLVAAALLATPALAQDQAAPQGPPQRIRSVILFGDEQCPKPSTPDEIVVCANGGDSQYRIPKRFREEPREGPGSTSWTRRMEVVEEVNRAGLPNSCSPIGTGGQTGCSREFIRQWAQEKLDKETKATRVP